MPRYVLADLEQVGAELAKRADEINEWLDAVAGRAPPPVEDPDLANAIAHIDLACYRALSSAATRLAAAADALTACAGAVRDTDAHLARRICRWMP